MLSEELAHLPTLDLHFSHFHALIGCFSKKRNQASSFSKKIKIKNRTVVSALCYCEGEVDNVITCLKFEHSRGSHLHLLNEVLLPSPAPVSTSQITCLPVKSGLIEPA